MSLRRIAAFAPCLVVAAMLVVSAPPAHAQALYDAGAATQDKPLLIIRFNQPRVYFTRSLQLAVQSAERAKPDVRYEVVSFAPSYDETAERNLEAVIGVMYELGVPQARIGAYAKPYPGSQEIHIYVK